MSQSKRILLSVALLATFAATASGADVWGWQDAEGKWHYSDVPTQGARLISKGTRSGAPEDSGNASGDPGAAMPRPAPVASDPVADRLNAEAAARAVQRDLANKRAEQCKQATERYESMLAARRLYRETKPGERTWLTDAEIVQARIDARRERDVVCGGASR